MPRPRPHWWWASLSEEDLAYYSEEARERQRTPPLTHHAMFHKTGAHTWHVASDTHAGTRGTSTTASIPATQVARKAPTTHTPVQPHAVPPIHLPSLAA